MTYTFLQIALDSRCFEYNRYKRDVYNNNGHIYSDRRRLPVSNPRQFGNPAVSHAAQDGVHKIYNLLSLTGKKSSQSQQIPQDYEHHENMDYYDGDEGFQIPHGKIHQSPDTHESNHNADFIKDLNTATPAPTPGGGGGGGATFVFKVRWAGHICI